MLIHWLRIAALPRGEHQSLNIYHEDLNIFLFQGRENPLRLPSASVSCNEGASIFVVCSEPAARKKCQA